MGSFKGTKGKFKIIKGDQVLSSDNKTVADCENNSLSTEETIYNAKLVCDAFNTVTECDLLPSELLKQRNELLKNLKYMVDAWEDVRISGRKDIMETFTEYAKEAIKKATE